MPVPTSFSRMKVPRVRLYIIMGESSSNTKFSPSMSDTFEPSRRTRNLMTGVVARSEAAKRSRFSRRREVFSFSKVLDQGSSPIARQRSHEAATSGRTLSSMMVPELTKAFHASKACSSE